MIQRNLRTHCGKVEDSRITVVAPANFRHRTPTHVLCTYVHLHGDKHYIILVRSWIVLSHFNSLEMVIILSIFVNYMLLH